jgi:hypothetical protein
VLPRDCSPLVALAVAACGPAFTVATGDGGPLGEDASFDASASGEDAGKDSASRHDATREDASVRDGGVRDGGSNEDGSPIELDGGVLTDAVACARTCPTGFDCLAAKCVDRAGTRFSATTNRPFNWSYGYTPSLGATFHLYVFAWSPGSSIDVWTDTNKHTVEPSVFHNGGLATQTYDGMTIPGEALGLYPGPTGQASIVRWTAPASGLFAIDATFTGVSTPATRIEVGVLINNTTGMNQSAALNAFGGGNTFTLSLPGQMLAAGASVDFYATAIANMDDPPGGTSVDARITAD